MELKQGARECVILLHEIYGINEHIEYYAHYLFSKGYDVYVPNLLGRSVPYPYESEEEAYQNFTNSIGFEKALQQTKQLLHTIEFQYSTIQIMGFSIGATIAWLCSEEESVNRVIGFYGSRIRQYTDLEPKAKVFLFYGVKEASFDPQQLANVLNQKKNVLVEVVHGEHGFADPYSSKYQVDMAQKIMKHLFGEAEGTVA